MTHQHPHKDEQAWIEKPEHHDKQGMNSGAPEG
jgi:hypothetical protein